MLAKAVILFASIAAVMAEGLGTKKVKLPEGATIAILLVVPIFSIVFAVLWWAAVMKIEILPQEGSANEEASGLIVNGEDKAEFIETRKRLAALATLVTEGAQTFLFAEYKYMGYFIAGFSVIITVLLGVSQPKDSPQKSKYWVNAILNAVSFIIGASTSIVSGYIGMSIAVFTNSRTAFSAYEYIVQANSEWKRSQRRKNASDALPDDIDTYAAGAGLEQQQSAYKNAFQTAFRGGLVMGFALTGLGALTLFITVLAYRAYFYSWDNVTGTNPHRTYANLYECVAAYGLGGSAIACFGRVGGGIFTKAADVGSDLVGKVERDIPEDDPRNPGVLADCVGDNVGDIAGMGSDLFGSFGEATCAAFVCSASCIDLAQNFTSMMFPLMITSCGLIACFFTSFIASHFSNVIAKEFIEDELKKQLLVSTVLTSILVAIFAYISLPSHFSLAYTFYPNYVRADIAPNVSMNKSATWGGALVCVLCGLWTGLAIGYITEYFTSNARAPTVEVSNSCHTGAATNIIYGLALGYVSVIVPVFLMAFTIYISYNCCLLYGFSLAALGILSTMSIGLTIDAYGPISDNAGGLAEMSAMHSSVRQITDALDAAGNTTAAIGKGFAISSAAMVGLALYGAFVTRCYSTVEASSTTINISHGVNIIDGRVLFGLLIGAMLPYWFSALTMKSVGIAANGMINEIRRQFKSPKLRQILKDDTWKLDHATLVDPVKRQAAADIPDYNQCIVIATECSLREMILPGALVILSPIICGIFFGKEALAGLLPGSFVSGVQMAISASNTGGAWDNAKKYIEGRMLEKEYTVGDVMEHAPDQLSKLSSEQKDKTFKIILYKTADEHHKIDSAMNREAAINSMWRGLSPEAKDAWYKQVRADFKSAKDAAVTGDTVGDPLKDTSGPALNILMKLMAIISVVFAPVVQEGAPLSGVIFDKLLKNFNADPFSNIKIGKL